MQIRPTMPSFKGYINVPAKNIKDKIEKIYTFNTNSIAFAQEDTFSDARIIYGDKEYATKVSYENLQKALIQAAKTNNQIVAVDKDGLQGLIFENYI